MRVIADFMRRKREKLAPRGFAVDGEDDLMQAFLAKKGEELPQLCVCHMDIEASSLPFIAIHTKLWQLLSCSATDP